ncbi:MAG: lysophospholipid acyltransferase family protein [Actinomycetota bacterium]
MGLVKDVGTVARGWRWTHRPLVPRSVPRGPELVPEHPTDWARTPAARIARELVHRFALGPLLRHEVDVEVHGLDVLDELEPPVIFVSNHASHLDAPAILTSLPPKWRWRTATGAAADYFFDVWWRAAMTTLVFNAFPVDRRAGRRAARKARDLLRDGWNVIVFPEGTRSKDGWVAALRSGAAWMAVETGTPVVPVALSGTYHAMPRGRGWPASGHLPVSVRFGRPLRPEPEERVLPFHDRIRRELATTLAEQRGTWWEAIRAAADGTLADTSGPSAARWRRRWEASASLPQRRPVRLWRG